jgi:activating signal cointegrator 1
MKVLTLTEPWATLVIMGIKKCETRSWMTPYRGPLLIHAAKGYPDYAKDTTAYAKLCGWLPSDYDPDTVRGKILGQVELEGCLSTSDRLGKILAWVDALTETEYALGNFAEGRYAWFLKCPQKWDHPVPARGALGLWEWSDANG